MVSPVGAAIVVAIIVVYFVAESLYVRHLKGTARARVGNSCVECGANSYAAMLALVGGQWWCPEHCPDIGED